MNNTALINRLKSYCSTLHEADLSELHTIYSGSIVFKDPVHSIQGLVELEDYFQTLCADLSDCRFEYLDELVSENSAYIKWIMHFRHPKLGNRLISVRGVSYLKFSEWIEYQEDFYDMGAMLYEQLPVLGNVTRWLRHRLAS
ncbi:MAG: nuclear transport factor 2 family protein [Gammaproteobacteria bacterium]|nr:nuclear transport factor 2 family protein [Gammaproteobacteria bacterium]